MKLNMDLLASPYNWAVVGLMLAMAGLAVALINPYGEE